MLGAMTIQRVVVIVGAVIAALLVAILVVLTLIIGRLDEASEWHTYENCMARAGFAVDQPAPSTENSMEVGRYVDAIADAAEKCSS